MASGEKKVSLMNHISSLPDGAKFYVVLPDGSYGFTTKADILAGIEGGVIPDLQMVLGQGGFASNGDQNELLIDLNAGQFNFGAIGDLSAVDASFIADGGSGIQSTNVLTNRFCRIGFDVDGNLKLTQASDDQTFRTELAFDVPLVNTLIKIKAKSISGTYYLATEDQIPAIDLVPTDGSANSVSSGGVFDALENKADLVGGMVSSYQLPGFVDDIIEGYKSGSNFYEDSSHTILVTASVGKIYVDLTSGQKYKQYRYTGTTYIQITNGLIASTDDVPEGSNLYFTLARVLATLLTGLTASSGTYTSSDSILTAFGKIKYFIDNAATTFLSINNPIFTGDLSSSGSGYIGTSTFRLLAATNGIMQFFSGSGGNPTRITFGTANSSNPGISKDGGDLAITTGNSSVVYRNLRLAGITTGFRAITTTATLDTTDCVVTCNGTFTVTLPTSVAGKRIIIKNIGTGTITVAGTIDGVTNKTSNVQNSGWEFCGDGSGWVIIAAF